ncbi:hypothetical protein [Flavilitoribacter nigricans]|nr:hypothetical protein [Flavilitoribacter nigricans]
MRLIYLLLILLIAGSPEARASIEVSNHSPEVGETITLTFSAPVDSLTVTYRPNSSVSKTEVLVNNPPATSMEWASKEPGLVSLSYLDRSGGDAQSVRQDLSIRFEGLSGSGLAVMLFAGIILFGGATMAFRTLFQEQDEGRPEVFDPEEMPDT